MTSDKFVFFNVGETYIKFNLEYSERNRTLIKEAYLKQVGLTSREYLKNKEYYKISIEYEKGSTKTKIVIWATALYLGIGNYGDFRAGVREIVNDVKSFASYVIDRIDSDPAIDPESIINTQRRTGIPGRLEDVYKKIEHLEKNMNNLSNNEIQTELGEIKQEISNLIALLPNQDSQAFLQSVDGQYTENLPQPDERKTHYLYSRYALKPEDEVEFVEE
jgi:hypothetical protein